MDSSETVMKGVTDVVRKHLSQLQLEAFREYVEGLEEDRRQLTATQDNLTEELRRVGELEAQVTELRRKVKQDEILDKRFEELKQAQAELVEGTRSLAVESLKVHLEAEQRVTKHIMAFQASLARNIEFRRTYGWGADSFTDVHGNWRSQSYGPLDAHERAE